MSAFGEYRKSTINKSAKLDENSGQQGQGYQQFFFKNLELYNIQES